MAVRTAANRARIIAGSRVRDDVGLTNQVCALKTGSGIQFRAPLRNNNVARFTASQTSVKSVNMPSWVLGGGGGGEGRATGEE